MQFGIVTPFALHQTSPQPSADDSACAKLGKGLKDAKSADKLMRARSGNDSRSVNDPTSVSCESLRAWASQPCVCPDATSRGLDLGSSGQEQPEKVRQKASPEIAMKRQVYHTVLRTYLGVTGAYVCCNHTYSQVQAAGPGFLQLPLPTFPPLLAHSDLQSLTILLICLTPHLIPLKPPSAPPGRGGASSNCLLPLQLVATPSLTYL